MHTSSDHALSTYLRQSVIVIIAAETCQDTASTYWPKILTQDTNPRSWPRILAEDLCGLDDVRQEIKCEWREAMTWEERRFKEIRPNQTRLKEIRGEERRWEGEEIRSDQIRSDLVKSEDMRWDGKGEQKWKGNRRDEDEMRGREDD